MPYSITVFESTESILFTFSSLCLHDLDKRHIKACADAALQNNISICMYIYLFSNIAFIVIYFYDATDQNISHLYFISNLHCWCSCSCYNGNDRSRLIGTDIQRLCLLQETFLVGLFLFHIFLRNRLVIFLDTHSQTVTLKINADPGDRSKPFAHLFFQQIRIQIFNEYSLFHFILFQKSHYLLFFNTLVSLNMNIPQ